MGLALMSKYYALILLATCGLGAIQTPFFAKYVRSAAPWISGFDRRGDLRPACLLAADA